MKRALFTLYFSFISCVAFAQDVSLTAVEKAEVLMKRNNKNDYFKAIGILLEEMEISTGTKDPRVRLYIAQCYENVEEFYSSVSHYEEFLRENPGYAYCNSIKKKIEQITEKWSQGELYRNALKFSNFGLNCKYLDILLYRIKKEKDVEEGLSLKEIQAKIAEIKEKGQISMCTTVQISGNDIESGENEPSDVQKALDAYEKSNCDEAIKFFSMSGTWYNDPVVVGKAADCYFRKRLYEEAQPLYEIYFMLHKNNPPDLLKLNERFKIIDAKLKAANLLNIALYFMERKYPVLAEKYMKLYIRKSLADNSAIEKKSLQDLLSLSKYIGRKAIFVTVRPNDAVLTCQNCDILPTDDRALGNYTVISMPLSEVKFKIEKSGYDTLDDELTIPADKQDMSLKYTLNKTGADYTASWVTFGISAAAITVGAIVGAVALTKGKTNVSNMSARQIADLNKEIKDMSISTDVLIPTGIAGLGTGFLLRYVWDL